MFAADTFEKLNKLNVTLQGKGLLAHEMWNNVKSFKAKPDLFARQAMEGNFCHFSLLGKQKVPKSISTKITGYLKSLNEEITRRFQDFQKIEPKFDLLSYPFTADINTAPKDLQSDYTSKEMFHEKTLIGFNSSLSSENSNV